MLHEGAHTVPARVDAGLTDAAAGREVGLSRAAAAHLRRLLRLAPAVQAQVVPGVLAPGTARARVGLSAPQPVALAARIVRERLTTRQAEALANAGNAGHAAAPVMASAGVSPRDPDITRLENDLAERLGTRVTLHWDATGSGQLTIDFDTLEILDGVLEKIDLTFRTPGEGRS